MLFINGCVRSDSRTMRLADSVIEILGEPVTELKLWELKFPIVDEGFLKKRDSLIYAGKYDDPMFDLAKQFSEADRILIAAPYWDFSFPAALRQYIELINVLGVTFIYTDEGIPKGLCRADKLTYVTTAGGDFAPDEYGFGYIKALAENYYGINEVELIKAVGLDLAGADADKIIEDKIREISNV